MSSNCPPTLGCREAESFVTDELLGPLAHRLANVAAPLAVGTELAQMGPLDTDMDQAMSSAVRHLERVSQLLAAVAGRRGVPLSEVAGLPVEFTGLSLDYEIADPALRHLLDAFRSELSAGALSAGATKASIDSWRIGGVLVCTWTDDGPGLSSDVMRSLGKVQTTGRGGCGLGLAAVAVSARSFGAHLGIIDDRIALVIPTVR